MLAQIRGTSPTKTLPTFCRETLDFAIQEDEFTRGTEVTANLSWYPLSSLLNESNIWVAYISAFQESIDLY